MTKFEGNEFYLDILIDFLNNNHCLEKYKEKVGGEIKPYSVMFAISGEFAWDDAKFWDDINNKWIAIWK